MLIKLYIIYLTIILSKAAKIGLQAQNARPSEEPSSLKSEIMKYKTSECGGSSSEEPEDTRMSKKHSSKRKKDSDESEENDSDEDGNKKKKNNNRDGKNNSRDRHRKGNNSGSNSFERGRFRYPSSGFGYAMMERRPPTDEFPNRQQGAPDRWSDQNQRNGYPNRPSAPTGPYPNRGNPYSNPDEQQDYYQGNNQRYPNRNSPSGPYQNDRYGQNSNRDRNSYQNDRYGTYSNRDQSYTNRDRPSSNRDRYSDRDNRNGNMNKNSHRNNNWEESEESDGDYYPNKRLGNNRNAHSASRHSNNRNNKRKNNRKDNNDGDCVSQCVFNNMKIMEDDGIPSEAAMIKWAQGKIKNEKLKTAAVKEIRKCFGTLASSDADNSCNFSKSLAACLKLGLDEDKD